MGSLSMSAWLRARRSQRTLRGAWAACERPKSAAERAPMRKTGRRALVCVSDLEIIDRNLFIFSE